MKKISLPAYALMLFALTGGTALAQPGAPNFGGTTTTDPGAAATGAAATTQAASPGYFSVRLGARFQVEDIPGFPGVKGARLLSQPLPDSPLLQISPSIAIGDYVSRINGVSVSHARMLEMSTGVITVKVFKAGVSSDTHNVTVDATKLFQVQDSNEPMTFSERLGVYLRKTKVKIGSFPEVNGLELASVPMPGSPLSQLGLTVGDKITKAAGLRLNEVSDFQSIGEVSIVFVKSGANAASQDSVFVVPNLKFSTTASSSTSSTTNNGGTQIHP